MVLCPYSACHQLRLDPVLLYDWLFDPFDHRSRLNTVTDVVSAAVIAVIVDPPLLCSSNSSIAFNVIEVSSWFFLCLLFHHFRFHFAGIALPSRHVRHGWCRAHFVPRSMPLVMSVGAHSLTAYLLVGFSQPKPASQQCFPLTTNQHRPAQINPETNQRTGRLM